MAIDLKNLIALLLVPCLIADSGTAAGIAPFSAISVKRSVDFTSNFSEQALGLETEVAIPLSQHTLLPGSKIRSQLIQETRTEERTPYARVVRAQILRIYDQGRTIEDLRIQMQIPNRDQTFNSRVERFLRPDAEKTYVFEETMLKRLDLACRKLDYEDAPYRQKVKEFRELLQDVKERYRIPLSTIARTAKVSPKAVSGLLEDGGAAMVKRDTFERLIKIKPWLIAYRDHPGRTDFDQYKHLKALDYIYGDRKRALIAQYKVLFSGQSLAPEEELIELLRDALVTVYGELQQSGMPIDIDTLFMHLKARHQPGDPRMFENAEELERGLEWLDLKGFALRRPAINNGSSVSRWQVQGLAKEFGKTGRYLRLDVIHWPWKNRLARKGLEGRTDFSAIVRRILILKKFNQLSWAQIGGTATSKLITAWKARKKTQPLRGAELDNSLFDLALTWGVEPILLRTGLSRTERRMQLLDELPRMPLNKRILELRQLLGLPRADLARIAGVNVSLLEDLELGWFHPRTPPEFWPALAAALQIDLGRLLEGETRYALPTPMLVWGGRVDDAIATLPQFAVHDEMQMVNYIWEARPSKVLWRFRRTNTGTGSGMERPEQFEQRVAQELLTAYRWLRDNPEGENGVKLVPLLRALKQGRPDLLIRNIRDLQRGLKWLELQGFPLIQSGAVWKVSGLARDRFFSMNSIERVRPGDLSGPAIAERLDRIREAFDLEWKAFGVSADQVSSWRDTKHPPEHPPSEFVLERISARLGIERVWLETGYSRGEFEQIAYGKLRRNAIRKNAYWLRITAGLSIQTLSRMIHVPANLLYTLENGSSKLVLSSSVWPRMARAFGQSPYRLWAGAERYRAFHWIQRGRRLELALKVRGMSPRRLAQRLGVRRSTVDRWLSGTLPDPRHRAEIARALRFPVVMLFGPAKRESRRIASPRRNSPERRSA